MVATLSRFNGLRLQKLRVEAGFTQDDLAWRVREILPSSKITSNHVSRYERNKNQPNSAVALALAEAVGVDVTDLYRQDENQLLDGEDEEASLLRRVASELVIGGDDLHAQELLTVLNRRARGLREGQPA